MQRFFLSMLCVFFCFNQAFAQNAGDVEYSLGLDNYIFYNGTEWRVFNTITTLIGCDKPGAMEFDSLLASYKICNGSKWRRVVGILTLSVCSKKGARDYFANSYYYCNGLLWANMDGGSAFGYLPVAAGDE